MKAVLRWKATVSLNSPHKLNAGGVTFARVHRYPEGKAFVEWSKEHLPSLGVRVPSGLGKRARPERHVYDIRLFLTKQFCVLHTRGHGPETVVENGVKVMPSGEFTSGLVWYVTTGAIYLSNTLSCPNHPLAISSHSSAAFDPAA
jgi:hypothetical protein